MYLLKNTLDSELLHTIRAVHAGKRSLSPEVSFQVAEHMSDEELTPPPTLKGHTRRPVGSISSRRHDE